MGRKGGYHSEATKSLMRLIKLGSGNPNWKGNEVKYNALHDWVKYRIPKPSFCEVCHIKIPHDISCINDEYSRDLSKWRWLCRKCHMLTDGRINNLRIGGYRYRDAKGKFCKFHTFMP